MDNKNEKGENKNRKKEQEDTITSTLAFGFVWNLFIWSVVSLVMPSYTVTFL